MLIFLMLLEICYKNKNSLYNKNKILLIYAKHDYVVCIREELKLSENGEF